ncbi:hypothetical protein ABZ896_32525 [Streptomyces sp. NPDC047072]|uniref:hypothetical protein n=1 Tax=Streptomyces sp. NPDC047072 TaxID=3154809 RepID=UPI0034041201
MRPPSRQALASLFVLGSLAVGGTGCSGSSTGAGSGEADNRTGLQNALASVPESAAAETVSYADVAVIRDLIAKDSEQFGGLGNYGIPELATYSDETPRQEWGFDEKTVATSVVVGASNSRLTGEFDTATIAKALERKGYRASDTDGGTLLKKTGDETTYQVSDSVRVARHDSDGAGLGFGEPERSVAGDPAYAAVDECLGNVYYASFYGKREKKDVVLLAIGARLGADGSSTETLCTVNSSEAAAQSAATKLREKTKDGEPYAGAKVTVRNGETHIVSMTWRNSSEPRLRPRDNDKTNILPGLLLLTGRS